ncbi:hypothetical protein ACOSQ3_020874 [Xanthoceras sorbifolium]
MKISEQNPAQTKIQKAKSANLAQIKIQKAKSAYVCVTVPCQKVVGQVTKCKSSLETWTKLKNLYSQKSMAKILNLRQQLQIIRKGSHSVSDFVLKIKNIGDALSAVGEEVSEIDLLLSLMHGVGHEYDVVMVLISSQRMTMSLEEAQFLLLMHEQRIEQLNSPSNFRGIFANFATNNAGDRRYHRSGSNYNRGGQRGRGRGGKFGGRKLYCQLSTKPGHQEVQMIPHGLLTIVQQITSLQT